MTQNQCLPSSTKSIHPCKSLDTGEDNIETRCQKYDFLCCARLYTSQRIYPSGHICRLSLPPPLDTNLLWCLWAIPQWSGTAQRGKTGGLGRMMTAEGTSMGLQSARSNSLLYHWHFAFLGRSHLVSLCLSSLSVKWNSKTVLTNEVL